MTRLDTLEAILAANPRGLGTADLAHRLGERRTGNRATLAQIHDLCWRLRRRGVPIEMAGGRYRLAS